MNEKVFADHSLGLAQVGTHRVLFTEEEKGLQDSRDLNIPTATMKGLVNFVQSRKDAILERKDEAHFQVETRQSKITLFLGEKGGRKLTGDKDRTIQTVVVAKNKRSQDFIDVLAYLEDEYDTPHNLAMDLRKQPHLFENETEWLRVVGQLRTMSTTVSRIMQDTSSDLGERTRKMDAVVTSGKLDLKWNFYVPIFEDEAKSHVPVNAIYEMDKDGKLSVVILSVSPGIEQLERDALKLSLDSTVQQLNIILGIDELPMVYVDGGSSYQGS